MVAYEKVIKPDRELSFVVPIDESGNRREECSLPCKQGGSTLFGVRERGGQPRKRVEKAQQRRSLREASASKDLDSKYKKSIKLNQKTLFFFGT